MKNSLGANSELRSRALGISAGHFDDSPTAWMLLLTATVEGMLLPAGRSIEGTPRRAAASPAVSNGLQLEPRASHTPGSRFNRFGDYSSKYEAGVAPRGPGGRRLFRGMRGSEETVRRFWHRTRYLHHEAADLEDALIYASWAHKGQERKSGDPYIVHPIEVATILADLRMDTDTLIAALLHDTVEDTHVTLDDITLRFGGPVATIVAGVTDGEQTCDASNQRELLMAMSADWRIVLVKLADRLHNMRTLDSMPRIKQVRKAEETMAMFVPLAKELGISQLEAELEVRCAQTLFPKLFVPLEGLNRFAVDAKPFLRVLREGARIKCPAQLDALLQHDTLLQSDAARRISGHRQRWAEHLHETGMLSDTVPPRR